MKYKVGDRVKVKSLDWYNTYKDRHGIVSANGDAFIEAMKECCGKDLTIAKVYESLGSYAVAENIFGWTDDMFEGLADEEQDYILYTEKDWDKEQEIQIADGFEFQDESGNVINAKKIKIIKKKPKYPTTYEECCEVLGIGSYFEPEIRSVTTEECHLFTKLIRIKRCRDAYWKIAGDWKPDWEKKSDKYNLIVYEGEIIKDFNCGVNHVLTFPTSEMRDTFYENFKDLIEQCKELL